MGIGKRIKEARETLGLTQKELAGLVDVSPSAIANYENDISHPKEAVLYKLIAVLKVDANYLFQDAIAKAKSAIDNKKASANYSEHLSEEYFGSPLVQEFFNLFALLDDEKKELLVAMARTAADQIIAQRDKK